MATRQERLLAKARELTARGDHARALDCYRELCADEPYDPDVWMRRAEAAETLQLTEEAVQALYHVCELYARAGMAEAGDIAERILALQPQHAGASQLLRLRGLRPVQAPAPGEAVAIASDSSGVPEPIAGDTPGGVPAPIYDSPTGDAEVSGVPTSLDSSEHAVGALTTQVVIGEFRDDHSAPVDVATGAAPLGPGDDPEKFKLVQAVAAIITTSPLLAELDVDLVRNLIEVGSVVERGDGEVVFREGEPGTALYLVLSGQVAVERDDALAGATRRLAVLRPGAFFGEISMLADAPRSATVRAVGDAALLAVPQRAIRELIQRQGRVLTLLMRFFRARLVGTLMATSPLFTALSAAERRELVGRFRLRELPAGRVAVREGDPADGVYMVLTGRLVASTHAGAASPPGDQRNDGEPRVLGELGPGDVFGEMSMLSGEPAIATVRAATRAWVVRLPPADYARTVAEHPELLRKLETIAARRRADNAAR